MRSKSGVVQIDLRGFLVSRMATLVPGNPDKTVNNLVAEDKRGGVGTYLYQAIPNHRSGALAIIAHNYASSSVPGDMVHDLVTISAEKTPKISFIRTIAMANDEPSSQAKYRLFSSKNQLLLRNRSGFEVIDNLGQKVADLPQQHGGRFVGLNKRGELVYVNTRKLIDLEVFNLATRQWHVYKLAPPEGTITSGSSNMLENKTVEILFNVNYVAEINGTKEQRGRLVRYFVNSNTGTLIGKPSFSDGGGAWHN
ncbi:MAG: hypothetical protein WCG75_05085 [Armatimonadota bacterium]